MLLTEEARADFETGALRFDIDDNRRIVTASRGAVSARARHFGDQGCVILPEGTQDAFFTPRPVVSALPDAASTPWPMGDLLPDEPLPPSVNRALLDSAMTTFFSNPRDVRAAFLVVHEGRIIAERYGSGAHRDMQLESWSMGKSMTATLIGRLIQMGHLRLWDPAPVPEWQNSQGDPRRAIRIADLLRMSSGLRFSGGGSTPEQMARSFIPGSQDHTLGYSAPIDVRQDRNPPVRDGDGPVRELHPHGLQLRHRAALGASRPALPSGWDVERRAAAAQRVRRVRPHTRTGVGVHRPVTRSRHRHDEPPRRRHIIAGPRRARASGTRPCREVGGPHLELERALVAGDSR
ncbi:MAG: serine hydrolase, partial [Longimicrobiales bacterium]